MTTSRTLLAIAVLLASAAASTAASSASAGIELAQATGFAPPAPGQPGGPPAGLGPLPAPAPLGLPPVASPPPAPFPPPLPPQVTAQFFYDEGGRPAGPFTIADLRARIAGGTITLGTLVWKSGTPNWVPAKDSPEVAALFGSTPSGGPPPAPVPALDPNTYLLGTWQSDDAGPPGSLGPARVTLTLGKGGSVNGTFAYSPGGAAARVSLPVAGFWSAEAAGNRRANLTLSLLIQDGAQVQTLSTTSVLDLIDNNTLRDVSDGSLTTRVLP